ncbi:MAG: GntR family transcriptional regulator [Spirochaetaceae bacterium]|jgi:DNA-binding LacI/PurR family transcriptional regulator|nr:GntR family transcriptional regulator [Spirochaetaceae bacterium]
MAVMQTGPFYRYIYDYLLEEINSGRLKGGDRAPTEKELCQQFGVSRITSKRALEMLAANGYIIRFRGKGSFIKDDVETGAISGVSGLIGLLIPSFRDFFGATFVCEAIKNCGGLGYHLLVKHTRDSVSEESDAINALTELNTAGILLMPVLGEYYNADILKLVLRKKPLVLVDRKMHGLAVPSVSTDNVQAAETGTNYLLGLGHRKIAFYSGPISDVSTVEDRKQGFIGALLKAGIVPDPALFCHELLIWQYPFLDDGVIAENTAVVKDHLKSHPEISAVFAAEYPSALLLQEAANQLGLAVPGDISIVCFDAPRGISPRPSFTSLCQDEKTLAKIAVDLLHKLIAPENPVPAGDILVPAQFVEGASTAPPSPRFL